MGLKTGAKKDMVVVKKAKTVGGRIVPKSLLQRGKSDKSDVMKATQMTSEEFQALQKGMKEKWPMPEYMNGKPGGMNFKDETFSAITCWTEKTRIEYRPHAKAPGSKSHLRYEIYSKTKTVGESLKCGCYPLDWCYDLERGFLRVTGGLVRDEPLDTSKVDENKLTGVDKAINTWYKRELARKLGLKVSDLQVHQGAGESIGMRGARLFAQRHAKAYLEEADKKGSQITDEQVGLTLKRWAFNKNPFRKNVMKEGQEWVFSDTLGLLRDRVGDIHLTSATRRYPQVAELFARWLTDRLPEDAKNFTFTSMNVNCNYAAQTHRDQGNFGPSFIRAFGDFTGGELNYWPEDDGTCKIPKLPTNGSIRMDLHKGLALFNGNCAHSVEKFEGSRYSIVFFTMGCHAEASAEDKEKLGRMSVPYPSATEDPHAILAKPLGFGKKVRGQSYRYYTDAKLPKKRRVINKMKKRVEPENDRSFYSVESRRAKAAGK